ncbi:MAG: hypothetical protein V5B32_05065 [Candidatus Accumulibacter sp. UW26]|jgi:hypothetical protein
MSTLQRFAMGQTAIPASTAWYLADLGEFRGKQERVREGVRKEGRKTNLQHWHGFPPVLFVQGRPALAVG